MSLYCVRHARLWAKERYSKAMQARTSRGGMERQRQRETRMEAREPGEWLTGRGACEPGRGQGPRVAVWEANGSGLPARQPSPIPACWQIRGSVRRRQAQARRERAEFSLQTAAPNQNPGRWASNGPKKGPAWPGQRDGRRQRNGPQPQIEVESRQPRVQPSQWQTLARACRWIPSSTPSASQLPSSFCLRACVQWQRRCTMQELRALGLGPQRPATAGKACVYL